MSPHRAGDNTARTKILDWAPYRNCEQLDRLRNWIANVTVWLYSSKPVLCLRIRDQPPVVAQKANAHKSGAYAAARYQFGRLWSPDDRRCAAPYLLLVWPRVLCTKSQDGWSSTQAPSQFMKGILVNRYFTVALVLLGYSAVAQECPAPHPSTPVVIHVPHEEYLIASLKSRLIRLLTDSLIDEGRGLVDVSRERQIQKLMKQIKQESGYTPHDRSGNDDDARRARVDSSVGTDGRKAPNSQTEMVTTTIR